MLEWLRSWLCAECRAQLASTNALVDSLKGHIQNKDIEIVSLLKTIIELQPESTVNSPSWLDQSKYVMRPVIQYVESGQIRDLSIGACDIYTPSPTLERIVIEQGWRSLLPEIAMHRIWEAVANRITYVFDTNDSWEFPTFTWMRQAGDCEDSTILMVTLARMSKIPADRIFNAAGYYRTTDGQNVGHSFPIFMRNDGKWYIYESTLDGVRMNDEPKLFAGSNYTADWGVANDKFAGGISNGTQI
jgi:transglutaminase-like putative cysteine protease